MFRKRLPFSLSVPALATLLLGITVTAGVFAGMYRLEREKAQLEFDRHAQAQLAALADGFGRAVKVLGEVNRLFAAFGSVSREQFASFTLPVLEQHPYIHAFNFHRYITAAERGDYERAMQQRYPGFTITELAGSRFVPAATRSSYRVVDYVEPYRGSERLLGFDADSYSSQIDAMQRAIDTGLPSATDMLKLLRNDGAGRGFLVLMPVYRHGAAHDSVAARRNAVVGDTAAVFDMDQLIRMVLSTTHLADGVDGMPDSGDIDIKVYSGGMPDAASLVYSRHQSGRHIEGDGRASSWGEASEPAFRTFDVAGKTWTIMLSRQPVDFAQAHRDSLLVMLVGALLSMLAAALVHRLSARASQSQRLAEMRTAELREASTLLFDDMAARRRTEQALQLRERAIESSANGILIIDAIPPDYTIDYVNPAFERITGYLASEMTGRPFRALLEQAASSDQAGVDEIRCALRERRDGHATLSARRRDGSPYWIEVYISPVRDSGGGATHFVVTSYDITAVKRYEAELEYKASRDSLTGLANRNLLRDRLSQSIAYASRYGHPVWVMFADLDRFKLINDTLGHQAGDALLKQVAERLQEAVRETDTVARLGGDEFVVILPERFDERLTMGAIQRIMDALSAPMMIEDHEFFPTCSAGVVVFPADGSEADTLIKHAEVAMYRAKESGRNNIQFYTPAMNAQALERLQIESHLRNAIERNELLLHYQPQVDLHSNRIVGVEALIRWQHPELGMVPPGRFIGLAEDTGLIVPIGAWVIRTACRQAMAWQREGQGALRVAVNLSARQFHQPDLVQQIAAALRDSGLAPEYFEVELTESLVMTDVERAISVLRELKALGVHIAIDDFGTGYSSLSYLKRFPIDILKIDQSFVRDISVDADDAAIVSTIVSLAHGLRLQVIAEGVETAEQLAYLREHGCDQMQGYYFSKPLPAAALEQLLRQQLLLAYEPAELAH